MRHCRTAVHFFTSNGAERLTIKYKRGREISVSVVYISDSDKKSATEVMFYFGDERKTGSYQGFTEKD